MVGSDDAILNGDIVPTRSFRFSIRTMLTAFVVCGLILWAGKFVCDLSQVPANAYATWDGACLVIDFMRTNGGEWPKSWDDLKSTLSKGGGITRNGLSFDELRNRLIVDFDAKPKELAAASLKDGRPEFRVIRLRNGKDTYWEMAEPNTLIYEYLTNPTELLQSGNYHSQIPGH